MGESTSMTDKYGNEVEVEVGADGESPVSPNNPPLKATGFMSSDAYMGSLENVPDSVLKEQEPSGSESAQADNSASENPEDGDDSDEESDSTEEDDEDADDEDDAPSRSASKATWVDYAVSQGMSRDEAESMTRDQIASQYA